uniref:hypothetical protein n=1 Tax=Lactobacillus taiwanensis TaxID=508451 RepID=UPI002557E093|nr:hypothetical protein [Lactobacillus taiwanensis]
MTDERNLVIKIVKGSPEDQWLRAQGNQSESIRALIKTAISQIGNVDFKEFLVNSAINNGNVRLFENRNSQTSTSNEESVANSSKNIKQSKNSSESKKVTANRVKNNTKKRPSELDYKKILNDPALS